MAVKISAAALVNYGASGSPFGSEVLLNAAVGPTYLSQATVALLSASLGASLPTWWQFVLSGAGATDIQYTPDSGTTWRSLRQGTGTLCYVDTGGSIRILNNFGGTTNIFVVPIKQ